MTVGDGTRVGSSIESVTELVTAAVAGNRRAVARLISMVEDGSPYLQRTEQLLMPRTGGAQVIGLTGAPGVGKSTSTSALVGAYRAAGRRVGVLAVDPSSPFTGGALLGDRIRMVEHATDPGVFIRSLATRGSLGGLSTATPQALRVLDAVGFDVVLIETVGVGQAEVDIAALADTTLVLVAPGMGDGVQAAKAGVLEIADVLVVNKADRPGADRTVNELTAMLRMGGAGRGEDDRRPQVVRTVAATGQGVAELVESIEAHRDWLLRTGQLQRRRRRRAVDEISRIAFARLRERIGDLRPGAAIDQLADEVVAGGLDPHTAADRLLDEALAAQAAVGLAAGHTGAVKPTR
ncbi:MULTISPECIES: methylmalonyl Co-A mutase-associated GTPase MeaB [Frankia]|uniref:methylmalonyl Co-A mutase-associated GTPase MeaB n=1 Tax=Frankia TaxID=1854 RepID=UPI001E2862C4|nr:MULTISPECIES: methylmalonyl Co-A mutase-associated GTPase MeaB [Frankia]